MNELIPMPSFPRGSPVSPDGLLASSPGLPAGRQVAAMSAWQNTLQPPPAAVAPEGNRGRRIFVQAGCVDCHDGVGGSGRTVVAADVVKTEPARAEAMRRIPNNFGSGPPRLWDFDTPVPLPEGAEAIEAEQAAVDQDPRLRSRPFARGEEAGAYKVPGLIGVEVSAPYLHDGGVAVAPGAITFDVVRGWKIVEADGLGMSGALRRTSRAAPFGSLLALIDRELRARVVDVNRADPALSSTHVTGAGHPFWVDEEGGFTPRDQQALIRYLLAWRYPSGP